jgi:hypothetical protein
MGIVKKPRSSQSTVAYPLRKQGLLQGSIYTFTAVVSVLDGPGPLDNNFYCGSVEVLNELKLIPEEEENVHYFEVVNKQE